MSKVLWMPSALNDLQHIQEFIARDSVYYANKFVDETFEATEQLELFSEMGRVVPEFEIPTIREIIHGAYRIIYELVDNKVNIVAMVHVRRMWESSI